MAASAKQIVCVLGSREADNATGFNRKPLSSIDIDRSSIASRWHCRRHQLYDHTPEKAHHCTHFRQSGCIIVGRLHLCQPRLWQRLQQLQTPIPLFRLPSHRQAILLRLANPPIFSPTIIPTRPAATTRVASHSHNRPRCLNSQPSEAGVMRGRIVMCKG